MDLNTLVIIILVLVYIVLGLLGYIFGYESYKGFLIPFVLFYPIILFFYLFNKFYGFFKNGYLLEPVLKPKQDEPKTTRSKK